MHEDLKMSDNTLVAAGYNRYGKLFHNNLNNIGLTANYQVPVGNSKLLPHVDLIKNIYDSDSYTLIQLNNVYCFGISFAADDSTPVCNGHGKCIGEDKCQCDLGYGGNQCQSQVTCKGISASSASVCNGRGTCIQNDVCNCTVEGFSSQDFCDAPYCFGFSSKDTTAVCSGHGSCIAPSFCSCTNLYDGSKCDTPVPFKPVTTKTNFANVTIGHTAASLTSLSIASYQIKAANTNDPTMCLSDVFVSVTSWDFPSDAYLLSYNDLMSMYIGNYPPASAYYAVTRDFVGFADKRIMKLSAKQGECLTSSYPMLYLAIQAKPYPGKTVPAFTRAGMSFTVYTNEIPTPVPADRSWVTYVIIACAAAALIALLVLVLGGVIVAVFCVFRARKGTGMEGMTGSDANTPYAKMSNDHL